MQRLRLPEEGSGPERRVPVLGGGDSGRRGRRRARKPANQAQLRPKGQGAQRRLSRGVERANQLRLRTKVLGFEARGVEEIRDQRTRPVLLVMKHAGLEPCGDIQEQAELWGRPPQAVCWNSAVNGLNCVPSPKRLSCVEVLTPSTSDVTIWRWALPGVIHSK